MRHNGSRGALNSSRLGKKGQDTCTRKMGHVRCSNGTRREGQGKGVGSDSLNVTRYCQSYGRLNKTQIGSVRTRTRVNIRKNDPRIGAKGVKWTNNNEANSKSHRKNEYA